MKTKVIKLKAIETINDKNERESTTYEVQVIEGGFEKEKIHANSDLQLALQAFLNRLS